MGVEKILLARVDEWGMRHRAPLLARASLLPLMHSPHALAFCRGMCAQGSRYHQPVTWWSTARLRPGPDQWRRTPATARRPRSSPLAAPGSQARGGGGQKDRARRETRHEKHQAWRSEETWSRPSQGAEPGSSSTSTKRPSAPTAKAAHPCRTAAPPHRRPLLHQQVLASRPRAEANRRHSLQGLEGTWRKAPCTAGAVTRRGAGEKAAGWARARQAGKRASTSATMEGMSAGSEAPLTSCPPAVPRADGCGVPSQALRQDVQPT